MEIKLKGREMPRSEGGDVKFEMLGLAGSSNDPTKPRVLDVFTPDEVVELVNRALYQLEYQAAAHRKRGQAERDRMKLLKEELKKAGKDVKATLVERELKGE